MKHYLVRFLLALVLVISITSPLYASVIRPNDVSRYHDKNNITLKEHLFVFDTVSYNGFNQNDLAALRIILARYEHTGIIPVGNGETPFAPAPVPEPITLILFGTGMIGAGIIARKKGVFGLKS